MPSLAPGTVFVLGAGAHVDYHMPTGLQLVEGFCEWASNRPTGHWEQAMQTLVAPRVTMATALRTGASFRDQLFQLAHKLGGSTHGSIDSLLEDWPEFEELGRRVTAAILLVHELHALAEVRPKGIYRWLASAADFQSTLHSASGKQELFGQAKIVTFNYDRLAEYHMARFLENQSAQIKDAAPPPVLHVYGKLASKVGRAAANYHGSADSEGVLASSDTIRIARTRQVTDKDEELNEIRNTIHSASRLVFLGFDFHPANLRRLGFPARTGHIHDVRASGYKLSEEKRSKARELIGQYIDFGKEDETCVDCLERWAPRLAERPVNRRDVTWHVPTLGGHDDDTNW